VPAHMKFKSTEYLFW